MAPIHTGVPCHDVEDAKKKKRKTTRMKRFTRGASRGC